MHDVVNTQPRTDLGCIIRMSGFSKNTPQDSSLLELQAGVMEVGGRKERRMMVQRG